MAKHLPIEDIYDAAFDDEAFARIAGALASTLDARSALIHWVHRDGSTDVLSHSGYFSDEQLGLYARDFAPLDPWISATAAPQYSNRVINLEEVVPVDEFIRTDFYNGYVRAIGDDTCRGIGIRLENDWGSGFVALQRGLGQASFGPDAVRLLSRNFHHVRRMLSIRGRVAAIRHRSEALAGALDAMGQSVLIVDSAMRLKHANSSAEQLLYAGDMLGVRGGTVVCLDARREGALRDAVARACSAEATEASALDLAGPDGSRLHLTITAAPRTAGTKLALILGGAQPAQRAGRASRLRALYGLSDAETSLALLLADGLAPAEIAERRQVAVGTVRVQIKRIAAKLGCRRQSDIVRVVTELPTLSR